MNSVFILYRATVCRNFVFVLSVQLAQFCLFLDNLLIFVSKIIGLLDFGMRLVVW
jgi:hypothetical protein